MFRAYPDLSGFAPKHEQFYAIDDDTYDGAPDAGPQVVGVGPTAEAAIADAIEKDEAR
jgi:hypothetical protein